MKLRPSPHLAMTEFGMYVQVEMIKMVLNHPQVRARTDMLPNNSPISVYPPINQFCKQPVANVFKGSPVHCFYTSISASCTL